mgnify:CR=1 FL=1
MNTREFGNEMAPLCFPNPSRCYDEEMQGVRFWGYDRTIEVSFFVAASAFEKINPDMRRGEADYLNTFDNNCKRIRTVANDVYSRRRKDAYIFSYALTDSDF